MGAASLAERVAAESVETDPNAGADASTPADGALDGVKTALSALAAWIPSEALGLYTLIYGTLIPKSSDGQVVWGGGPGTVMDGGAALPIQVPSAADQLQLFWIVLGVSVVLLVVQTESARRAQARLPGRRLKAGWRAGYVFRTVMSAVLTAGALVLYIANAPGNPFVEPLGPIDADWAPGYAAVAAILIPVVAIVFKVRGPAGEA